nr:MAG: hypothetical protein [Microviridae sp.]
MYKNHTIESDEKSQDTTEKQDKQNSFKRENVKNTPFQKITDESGIYYVMGDSIIQKVTDRRTEKTIEETLMTTDWEIIIPIMASIINKILSLQKPQEKKTKKN